nr:hypothetical protein CFP56_22172 [Quercus suber]
MWELHARCDEVKHACNDRNRAVLDLQHRSRHEFSCGELPWRIQPLDYRTTQGSLAWDEAFALVFLRHVSNETLFHTLPCFTLTLASLCLDEHGTFLPSCPDDKIIFSYKRVIAMTFRAPLDSTGREIDHPSLCFKLRSLRVIDFHSPAFNLPEVSEVPCFDGRSISASPSNACDAWQAIYAWGLHQSLRLGLGSAMDIILPREVRKERYHDKSAKAEEVRFCSLLGKNSAARPIACRDVAQMATGTDEKRRSSAGNHLSTIMMLEAHSDFEQHAPALSCSASSMKEDLFSPSKSHNVIQMVDDEHTNCPTTSTETAHYYTDAQFL